MVLMIIKKFLGWINVPWGAHPDKVQVSSTGHMDPDQSVPPADVRDFPTTVRSSATGVMEFALADPAKDTPEVFKKAVTDWAELNQVMAWRTSGYLGIPQTAMPPNSEWLLPAHDAVQALAPDLRQKVAAPFIGLDLAHMAGDADHTRFIVQMELAHSIYADSLHRFKAFSFNSIAQRLRPIYEALPVIKDMKWLYDPLEPLRKLFNAGAVKAVDTKDKLAHAIGKQNPPGTSGTPATPAGEGGTPGTGTAPGPSQPGPHGGTTAGGTTGATGQGTGTTTGHTGHTTGHTTHSTGHTTHKKTTP